RRSITMAGSRTSTTPWCTGATCTANNPDHPLFTRTQPRAFPRATIRSSSVLRFLTRLFAPQASARRHGRPAKQARPRLALETLEDRCVPATLQVVNGLLTYTAGSGVANNLTVATSVTGYIIKDTAETINVIGIPGASGSGTHAVILYAGQVPAGGM